jgi:hypothetical protein
MEEMTIAHRILAANVKGRKHLGDLGIDREDFIKMDRKEILFDCVGWIYPVQGTA